MEPKIDGRRLLVSFHNGTTTFLNRNGEPTNTGRELFNWLQPMAEMGFNATIDGEYIDGRYYVFDVVSDGPHWKRDDAVRGVVRAIASPYVHGISYWYQTSEKLGVVAALQDVGAEGVVFKHREGTYTQGIRNALMLKWKFTKELDAVVLEKTDGKDSVTLGLNYTQLNGISTCTAIGNCSVVGKDAPVGSVVRVRYLYASENNQLVQPRIIEVRDDKKPHECGWDQLRQRSIPHGIYTQD